MAKAFKCDHCKELTEKAQSDDVLTIRFMSGV
jgi:hypothetical protein